MPFWNLVELGLTFHWPFSFISKRRKSETRNGSRESEILSPQLQAYCLYDVIFLLSTRNGQHEGNASSDSKSRSEFFV